MQIVTALQPKVARLVNYVRGQNWIVPPVGFEPLLKELGRESGTSEEDARESVRCINAVC